MKVGGVGGGDQNGSNMAGGGGLRKCLKVSQNVEEKWKSPD
jgi:hypothetical protein